MYPTTDAITPVFEHPLLEEIYRVRDDVAEHINEEGGMVDAFGRRIELSAWDGEKKPENRWRGVLAYVNCTYELALIYECFKLAIEEREWAEAKTSRRVELTRCGGASGFCKTTALRSATAASTTRITS
jgi:hypothetical protein